MASKEAQNSDKLSGKKVSIMIHKDHRPHAVDPVPVSINGYQWTIRRGEVVEVPVELIEVLSNAKETHYEQVVDKDHAMSMVPREVLSYPFQVV